jgi:two-component system CheB/CheR fusion protein
MSADQKRSGVGGTFPIVGIGASAGGFDAFGAFFAAMPADSGMAFVLVQYLDPTHESLTARLLARRTAMPVIEIKDRLPVEANHVYVIPPNRYLTISDSVLHLHEPVLQRGMRMPIDYFLRSLAKAQREKAIGIILSGTGTDGTLGVRAIKGEGGIALAQSPETAQYDGMPRSAIATGVVDYIGPIESMPDVLVRYSTHAYAKAVEQGGSSASEIAELRENGAVRRIRLVATPATAPSEVEGPLVISFQEEPAELPCVTEEAGGSAGGDEAFIQQLERELQETRNDLQGTIEEMESSNEELKAANEEVMSVNEELQLTNEELETSKEELRSLNEELLTVNCQLEEKLRELEAANDDLDNLLSSTDIATIFLDRDMNIKRFTAPATRLFNLIATDEGRPVSDISPKFDAPGLLADASVVLDRLVPIEKEVRVCDAERWYLRRILPYRTRENRIEGVVVSFIDITERKRAAEELHQAKEQAERANQAKSRLLASASHDLRQPLQTLTLLNSLLRRKVDDAEVLGVVQKQGATLLVMNHLLHLFLDLCRIDAGSIKPDISTFPVAELLAKMKREFETQAEAVKLSLRVLPCSATICSDAMLLRRILQNLVSNAINYTEAGRVLVGCRRRGETLRIEVWDTGPGIPREHLDAIFEEFFQLNNPGRQTNKGYGVGLSVARHLAHVLRHRLDVRSTPGRGSVFAVEVPRANTSASALPQSVPRHARPVRYEGKRDAVVLVVDDDPGVLAATRHLLESLGLQVIAASSGIEALALIKAGGEQPDLIIADYRLGEGGSGTEMIRHIREGLEREVPAVLITGDTLPESVRDMEASGFKVLHKPIEVDELVAHMNHLRAV